MRFTPLQGIFFLGISLLFCKKNVNGNAANDSNLFLSLGLASLFGFNWPETHVRQSFVTSPRFLNNTRTKASWLP